MITFKVLCTLHGVVAEIEMESHEITARKNYSLKRHLFVLQVTTKSQMRLPEDRTSY